MQHSQPNEPRSRAEAIASLGLRLPAASLPRALAAPGVTWGSWQTVPRAKGFHVSRESSAGQVEAILNTVGRTKVFRSQVLADKAAAAENFKTQATQLAREPLLGGKGGAS
jgi:hypothetical protein